MADYFRYLGKMFSILWDFSPIWLPLVTGFIAWELWLDYIRGVFAGSKPRILLEILLPQEINKSPAAMELVLTSLFMTSRESTFIDRNLKGQSRPVFSLEIASIEGKVHFYIYTEKDFKNIIESQIYSQFPNIEVREVQDYTKGFVYQPGVNQMFGSEFIKLAVDALPIKTYVAYGLDRDPKEEFKIDPMTPTLEYMGSLGQGEQLWLQLIIRAHKDEKIEYVDGKRKKVGWAFYAEKEKKKRFDALKDKANPTGPARRMTKSEEEVIAAIDRSVSKLPFDVGIRAIYFAQPASSFVGVNRAGLVGTIRQYNSPNMNGFKPSNATSFDYPWMDFRDWRMNKYKTKMMHSFRQRAFFHLGDRKSIVMNTEEIATMFHFPGGVAATPTFARIMSKKSQAPANLPI